MYPILLFMASMLFYANKCLILLWIVSYSTSVTAEPKIELRFNINQKDVIILSCVVTDPLATAVYLACPLAPTNAMCFENCEHTCATSNQHLCPNIAVLNAIKCRRLKKANTLITSYTINRTNSRNNGPWYCMHAGVKSSPFGVETQTSGINRPATQKPVSDLIDLVKPENLYEPIKNEIISSQEAAENKDTEQRFLSNLTRMDLAISVVILLGLSLFVNLAFCIRCLLVRRFILKEKENKNVACLQTCLCISNKYKGRKPGGGVYDDLNTAQIYNPRAGGGHLRTTAANRSSQPDLRSDRPLTKDMRFGSANPINSHSTAFHQMPTNIQKGMSASAVLIPAGVTPGGDLVYIMPAIKSNGSTGALRNSRMIYDDVAAESPYDPIPVSLSHSGSLSSLHHNRLRRVATLPAPSPLPEESHLLAEENGGPVLNGRVPSRDSIGEEADGSSTQDSSVGGNPNRFQMSRNLLQQADSLLREAGSLLD